MWAMIAKLAPMIMGMMQQGGGQGGGAAAGGGGGGGGMMGKMGGMMGGGGGGGGMMGGGGGGGGKPPDPSSSTARNALRKQMHRRTPMSPMISPQNYLGHFQQSAPPAEARMPYSSPQAEPGRVGGTPWDF